MKQVADCIAKSLFRKLSGFPGYPKEGPGEDHFIDAFQAASISVGHAEAVIAAFDERMPTIRDIRDTALNLRPKFEPTLNQRAEWEKQYGPPRPFPTPASWGGADSIKIPVERECDRLAREVMQELARERVRDVQRVSWGRWWQIAKALGFPMNVFQQREIDDYEAAHPNMKGWKPPKVEAPSVVPITQADIDKAKAGRQSSVAVEEDPDRWE